MSFESFQDGEPELLGRKISEHKSESISTKNMGIGAVILVVVMIWNILSLGDLGVIICLGVVVLGGVYIGILYFRTSGNRVVTYENGLVKTQNSKIEVIRWEDVEAVWQEIVTTKAYGIAEVSITYKYKIETRAKKKYEFGNNWENIERLGQIIQEKSLEHIFPRVVEALKEGEMVSFGAIGISSVGLHSTKSVLAWDDIDGVRVKNGKLSIKQVDSWFDWSSVTVANTPNFFVLISLIDQIVGIEH